MKRRVRLCALIAAVAWLFAGIVSGSATATTHAATHVGQLWLDIKGQTPAIPSAADTLVITGDLVNDTNATVTGASVRLRVSPTPVRSRAEIPTILAGDAGRTGVVVTDSTVQVPNDLAPGARQNFVISVPVANLGLPAQDAAVFVIGIEALVDTPGDGAGPIEQDFVRSFVPWFPVPGAVSPTKVVWLYPLSSAPARLSDGVFLDDHLAHEISPTGRLTRILRAAAVHPEAVSWVVDPALLEAINDMADGYEVKSASGTVAPGEGQGSAAAWLTTLRLLTASAEVTAIPYGNPDVVALHRAGLDVDVALATTTAATLPAKILGRGVANGLAWPPGAITDDGALDVMRAAGSRAIVLSGSQLVSDPTLSYTPSGSVDIAGGVSPLRAAVSDPQLSFLSTTEPSKKSGPYLGSTVQGQEFLAELATTSLELPSVSRTLVVAPPVNWDITTAGSTLIQEIAHSEFARPETLGVLLATPPSDIPRSRLDYSAQAMSNELNPRYLRDISSARADLALIRAVAPDATGNSATSVEAALTRGESASWRTMPRTGQRLVAASQDSIDADIAKIRILSRAPVTLPGDQGVIPITLANDLDRPARVGVRLTSTPSVRFAAPDVPTVTLQPGQKETLEVSARVIGTGPVDVNIELLTPDGSTFGKPVSTQVRSAAYAHAAQWVVITFFAALVLLMVRGALARRTSERAR